jgi:hypothetical protein
MYRTEARLKPETPFTSLFPEGSMPVRSIVPIKTDQGTFYIVNAKQLMPEQIQGLGELLLKNGQGVPRIFRGGSFPREHSLSMEEAIAYIHEGLPVRTDWFDGAGTNNSRIFFSMMDSFDDEEDEDKYFWYGADEEDSNAIAQQNLFGGQDEA